MSFEESLARDERLAQGSNARIVQKLKLTPFRQQIADMLANPKLDPREFLALTTALGRLDDKPVNDDGHATADYRATDSGVTARIAFCEGPDGEVFEFFQGEFFK